MMRAIRRQQPRRVFKDRRETGQVLAGLLQAHRGRPDVVIHIDTTRLEPLETTSQGIAGQNPETYPGGL